LQLEYRQLEELEELEQRLTKQFDARQVAVARELEAHLQQQAKERDRAQHAAVAQEAKRRRHILQNQEQELKQLHQQQKKDYQKNKDDMRKVIATCCNDRQREYLSSSFSLFWYTSVSAINFVGLTASEFRPKKSLSPTLTKRR
jgi:hypothetical protein